MSGEKFTKGPWVMCPPSGGWISIRENPDDWDGMGYQSIASFRLISKKGKDSTFQDEQIANFRLMAAAPDLYRFAEKFIAWYEDASAGSSAGRELYGSALLVTDKARGDAS